MTEEKPLTRKQHNAAPYTQRFKQTKTPRKPAEKYSRSGKNGCEPKQKCPVCGLYMYKQSSRVYGDKAGWIPTSWLCRKCGHMELYPKGFEAVKIE